MLLFTLSEFKIKKTNKKVIKMSWGSILGEGDDIAIICIVFDWMTDIHTHNLHKYREKFWAKR